MGRYSHIRDFFYMRDCENWVKFGVWLVQWRDLEMSKTDAPPGGAELAAR